MRKFWLFWSIFYLMVSSVAAEENMSPQVYLDWLRDLKQEMADRGISQKTINAAFAKNYYHPHHEVVKKDRKQTEFVLTTSDYLHRVIAPLRVKQGREHYKRLLQKYPHGINGVPLRYLIAFWGIETNYGIHKGGFNAIEALTMLSYDKRRPQFFREELYHALKIIDDGYIGAEQMESSWAGAMGHFQFMPSTFAKYALDAENDGKIDIWHNFNDAIFSAANYLQAMGWDKTTPWGKAVVLSDDFDYMQTGRHKVKTVREWRQAGVKIKGAKEDWKGSIIVPEGHRGQAYIIFNNFHLIMNWNKSENYALAVGLLADQISNPQIKAGIPPYKGYRLNKTQIKQIQNFINQQKIAQNDEDGALGSKTRQAVQKLQRKFKLPADGYPDYRLLENIKNFKSNGYSVPVPSQKLHREK